MCVKLFALTADTALNNGYIKNEQAPNVFNRHSLDKK